MGKPCNRVRRFKLSSLIVLLISLLLVKLGLSLYWERTKGLLQPHSEILPLQVDTVQGISVDFVYTWVDSSDKNWQKTLEAHLLATNQHIDRNRYPPTERRTDFELETSVKTLQRFVPWVRTIWIVTQRPQVPAFLQDPDFLQQFPDFRKKIHVVHHDEIFQYEYASHLPVFNSHAIEAHIHLIPGLSEYFIYLNDDMLFGNHAFVADFFSANGNPLYRLELKHSIRPIIDDGNGFHNAWANVGNLLRTWPFLARPWHTVIPLRKSILKDIWYQWPSVLSETSSLKFRSLGKGQVPPVGLAALFALYQGKAYRHRDDWPVSFLGFGTGQTHNTKTPKIPPTTTLCINEDTPETLAYAFYIRNTLLLPPPVISRTSHETFVVLMACPFRNEIPYIDTFPVDIHLESSVVVICFTNERFCDVQTNYLDRLVASVNTARSADQVSFAKIELPEVTNTSEFVTPVKQLVVHHVRSMHQESNRITFVSYAKSTQPWEEEWTEDWSVNKKKNSFYHVVSEIARKSAYELGTHFETFVERWCQHTEELQDAKFVMDLVRSLHVAYYPKMVTTIPDNFFYPGWDDCICPKEE